MQSILTVILIHISQYILFSLEFSSCLDLLLSGQTKSGVYKIEPDSQTAFEVCEIYWIVTGIVTHWVPLAFK
jgi:hypothetical protein